MFPTFKEGIEYNAILGENGTKYHESINAYLLQLVLKQNRVLTGRQFAVFDICRASSLGQTSKKKDKKII